jgi:DNA polymerase-4
MQRKIAFTASDNVLIPFAHELFDRLYTRRMLLRLVGVKLSGLIQGNQQIDIFRDDIKMVKLYQAMDWLKHRYDNPVLIRRATGFSAYEHH